MLDLVTIQKFILFNLFTLAILSPQIGFSFRGTVFEDDLTKQNFLWLRESAFTASESAEESQRPIWILGGDSLATAWGNHPSIATNIKQDLPIPLPLHLVTQAAHTWYAGSKSNGLLRLLNHDSEALPFVVASAALGGSKITDTQRNPLDNILMLSKLFDRVELITLSLGGNDLCQDASMDAAIKSLEEKFGQIRRTYTKAKIISWLPPNLFDLRQRILDETKDTKFAAACRQIWDETNCPAIRTKSEEAHQKERALLRGVLEKNSDLVLEPMNLIQESLPLLSLLGPDCFHPSLEAAPIIASTMHASFLKLRETDNKK